jgi:hypothetical protein
MIKLSVILRNIVVVHFVLKLGPVLSLSLSLVALFQIALLIEVENECPLSRLLRDELKLCMS